MLSTGGKAISTIPKNNTGTTTKLTNGMAHKFTQNATKETTPKL
jgi:hypothetical protein